MGANKSLYVELWEFIKLNKHWWLLPVIIMLIIVSVAIIIGSSSISPFLYPLF